MSLRNPSREYIEVQFGPDIDTRRVIRNADHALGLGLFRHVTVYTDPADPERMRLGGVLQLWLWPFTMVLVTALCGLALAGTVSITRGDRTVETFVSGRWHFSPPPPAKEDIVLRAPASEVRAPLFWSLLGIAAFCCGVFGAGMSPFSRLWALMAGGGFILSTWLLALNNYTLHITANPEGLRATSALGWRQARWEEVKSVEEREVFSANRKPFEPEPIPSPGKNTRTIVFADAGGRVLLRMSTRMQPPEGAIRLFALCQARTGLVEQFRRVRLPEW